MKIIVNGEEREISTATVTYEQIVRLAIGPSKYFRDLTVTFRKAATAEAGTMYRGKSVVAKDGTIFNAVDTGSA